MIRRLFWLIAGAVIGIAAYRRVEAVGRAASAALAPSARAGADPAGPRTAGQRGGTTGQGTITRIRRAVRFARDVREGMEMYMDRHQGRLGPRLEGALSRYRLASTGPVSPCEGRCRRRRGPRHRSEQREL
jgi:hypothetical protein